MGKVEAKKGSLITHVLIRSLEGFVCAEGGGEVSKFLPPT